MTSKGYVATAETEVSASPMRVWEVLTDLAQMTKLWFGAQVATDWRPGSRITWSGVWDGKPYQDKGEILTVEPGRLLAFTHFSPLTGQPDIPESYHTLTFTLTGEATLTRVKLTQDNNDSEAAAKHSQEMWETLVTKLKDVAETD